MLKIIISGINGKMGQTLYQTIEKSGVATTVCGVDKKTAGLSVPVFDSFFEVNAQADCIIDFSRPEVLHGILEYAKKTKTPVVLATTGYSESDIRAVEEAARVIPVFMSGNMSLGINLLCSLIKQAARVLGDNFDVEIIEEHHNQKVDAPSGTAIMLAKSVNEAKDYTLSPVYGRCGKTEARKPAEIGIHSIRGGTVVGEHTVAFFGPDEVIRFSHSAHSKQIFASGALKAAQFLVKQQKGLYNMNHLVSSKEFGMK